MFGVVCDTFSGVSKKTGEKFHKITVLAQNSEGQIGTLVYFLNEFEQEKRDLFKIGAVVEIETEEKQVGMNTYTNITSCEPDLKTECVLDYQKI